LCGFHDRSILNALKQPPHDINDIRRYWLHFGGYASQAREDPALKRAVGLLGDLVNLKNDRFRAFVVGWTALEIFTNKTFSLYEKTGRVKKRPRSKFERVVARLRRLFRLETADTLTIRFRVIAEVLCPQGFASDAVVFHSFKKTRDHIYHTGRIVEQTLPRTELYDFLRKYIRAFLDDGAPAIGDPQRST
jgi:hypothetical protein